jgi:hypothetical protein
MASPKDPLLIDPYVGGSPLPPPAPRDPNAATVLDPTERGEDPMRGDIVDTLTTEPARPLTQDEKDAAEDDPGRPPRTFAPASERVPKDPAPGHEDVVLGAIDQPVSAEAAAHPGDRSDPREFEEHAVDARP